MISPTKGTSTISMININNIQYWPHQSSNNYQRSTNDINNSSNVFNNTNKNLENSIKEKKNRNSYQLTLESLITNSNNKHYIN